MNMSMLIKVNDLVQERNALLKPYDKICIRYYPLSVMEKWAELEKEIKEFSALIN